MKITGAPLKTLRPYQQEGLDAIRAAYRHGARSPLYVLPTGGGKTFVFSHIAAGAQQLGKRICILVHRQELLLQSSRALSDIGVEHGIIAPGFTGSGQHVQVASVHTLVRRLRKGYNFDLLIIDECHHAIASTWLNIINAFPKARVLGVTATPIRGDGRGLGTEYGGVFDKLVVGPSVKDLIDEGFLVRSRVYASKQELDLRGVKKYQGDFNQAQAVAVVDRPTITGDAVAHYRKICGGQPAIAFAIRLDHAHHVCESFKAAGYQSAVIEGTSTDQERRTMLADLGNGSLDVLCSCDLIGEGVDVPVVQAAILLRPTMSTGLYLQQVGRAKRPAKDKVDSTVLDHAGNCLRHGLPDEVREWGLDGEHKTAGKSKSEVAVKQCPKCYSMHAPAPNCPECGYVYEQAPISTPTVAGDLEEIDEVMAERLRKEKRREIGRARTLEELQVIGRARGYKPQWAHFIYKARGGR